MTNQLSGSCLCGAVEYAVTGQFSAFYLCHCRRCRKGSGSAHASNLLSEAASLSWRKGADGVRTFRLPGTQHSRSFCGECGSALPVFEGDLLVVPAGSVEGDLDLAPVAHIYTASRATWDRRLEDVREFAELPV